jgi:ATP-grasp domain, R2K clade family 3
MKPTWLIETGVWKGDNVSRMIGIIRGLGLTVHTEEHTPLRPSEFDTLDDAPDYPIIYYGSLNTVEYLRVRRPHWVPLIWFDSVAFSCQSYYARWGAYLLQERYGFYPLGELLRLKEQLYCMYGKEEMIFIRPDDNDKSFSGRLVPLDNFSQWYEEAQAGKPNPAALVVVSAPIQAGGEWRFVIADRKVVAGTHYKWAGKVTSSSDDVKNAGAFAEDIAAAPWQPASIYVVDITRTSTGRYRLVEIGGINSAGLYHCELLPVIQAMNGIATRDFRSWKGK